MLLPDEFKARMQQLLGPEAEKLFAALAQPAVTGLRVNTLKVSPEDFWALGFKAREREKHEDVSSRPLPFTPQPVPWCPAGFVIPNDSGAGKHPFHVAGLYYLQEPSAMSVAEALAPQAGDLVLDLAAAPGGKTTHIAALTNNKSVIIANEIAQGRTKALAQNLERVGSTHAVLTSEEVGKLAKHWGAIFDRVLLDAPCSGEGMFRKSSEALERWSERSVLGCAKRQATLLDDAAKLVKVGGYLVYSTCTFAPEENEMIIAKFLKDYPEFELCEIPLEGASPGRPDWVPLEWQDTSLQKTLRLFPHQALGEGHFLAKLQKTSGTNAVRKSATFYPVGKDIEKKWLEFSRASFRQQPFPEMQLTLFGEKLFALPQGIPQLRGLKALRTGLWLGSFQGSGQKARFEPAHSLALALKEEVGEGLELQGDTLQRYLQGHELEAPGPGGWLVLTVKGFPLGWGRRSKGIIKNAYPKGLRLSA
jgi:NOL1/NOP2/sun family putative RNA methylase